MNPPTGRPRTIGILLLAALAVRLVWALGLAPPADRLNQLPDQQEYLSLGRNLLVSGTLSFVDPRFGQRVYAFRSPGYPLMVAACGGNIFLIRVVQAVIDTSTALAAYLLAFRLTGSRRLGNVAATLIALNPFLVYFCGLILSETLFVGLVSWAVCLLAYEAVSAAGLLLAMAAAVRPEALVLGPMLAMAAVFLNPRQGGAYNWKRALLNGAVVGVITAGVLLPWAWRNHRVLGSWIWTTTNSGVTLYDGLNPTATGASDQRFLTAMLNLRPITELQRSVQLRQMAFRWAAGHVGRLPGLTLRKIARTWSPVPLSQEFGRPVHRMIAAVYAVPLDLLVIVGLRSRRVLSGPAKLLLCTTALWITLVHAVTVGSLRYRLAAEPMLAVVAAAAIQKSSNDF